MVHLTSKSSFKGKMMMMLMHIPGHTCDAEDHQFRPLPPLLHGPVLMFLCPLLVLLMMDSGQKGTWPVCTYAVPYTANYDALVSVRTYMNFFGSLSYVNPSVESAHTRPAFVPCMHQWAGPPATLSLVHHCFYLGPLLIDTDQCKNGLTQSPSQFGSCQTHSNPDTCPLFLLLTHQLWGENVHLLPNIAHLQTGATMRR